MLAETFEDIRMKFVAEKVRHNPVEMAYHAEGNGWELSGMSAGRTKFWGMSLSVAELELGKTHFPLLKVKVSRSYHKVQYIYKLGMIILPGKQVFPSWVQVLTTNKDETVVIYT